MGIPIALAMSAVRAEAEKDFTGVLEKAAGIGYKGVVFSGFGGLSAGELAGRLEKLGIHPVGASIGVDALEKGMDALTAFCAELGTQYIICSYAPIEDKAGVAKHAALFNAVGQKVQAAGLEFCYHNHSRELSPVDGQPALDLLMKQTDPSFVEIAPDAAWAQAAGADPVELVSRYAGRCPLVFLKDLKAGSKDRTAELGAGSVNVAGVVKEAEKRGVEWLIVDQDTCDHPPLQSVQISMDYLRKNGLA